MPALTRQLRNTRRAATKRTILSSLDETQATSIPLPHHPKHSNTEKDMDYDINASNKEAIELLLVDLESQVNKKITSIIMNAKLACEQLKQVGFLNSLPIEKKVKNMTVKEYNEQFGANVLECVQHAMNTAHEEGEGIMRRKRAHLETPARSAVGPMIQRTPFISKTGSPVDFGLVATVAKKRRMGSAKFSRNDDNAAGDDVTLSLDVGKGQYISLSDPSSLEHLDVEMKDTARTQLKVLQDQMAKLMAQLGN